ncbi:alpha-L-rhamnosidase [Cellulomonas sp. KRMCY2]|uniref:alpha-L-rhamnosidase n=1 Tax=Cellulomonas sp. KRMCY2 TaxID=1304865 RepID=UPI00045EA86B|nr:alpha-L-rhamnosidase [Cellulomonas sp. KRMCY2]
MTVTRITALWAGDRGRPAFLATGSPTLSWAVDSAVAGWEQTRAELALRLDGAVSAAVVTGPVAQKVGWPFAALGPYATAEIRVRVQGGGVTTGDPAEAPSGWSAWTELRTGPLGSSDWRAPFITVDPAQGWPDRATARFRTELTAPTGLVSALLSVTAHGVLEASLAGVRVGDEELAPGWTAYRDVLTFATHDVTAQLVAAGDGPVVLGATVAEGWYGERFGFDGSFARAYLGPVALAAQLRLVDADGQVTWVTTGPGWTATTVGPVTSASIYQGEDVDARLADDALLTPGSALPDARPAVLLDGVLGDDPVAADLLRVERLVPAAAPPVRVVETVAVREVLTAPSGATLLDFGQNLVGRLRLRVDGPAGTTITVRHAEVLEHGELGVRPLRFAKATDHLTLAGDGALDWHPRFTFHGFRYAEVSGWPGTLDPAAVVAEVIHTDLVRTGHLRTGHPKLDQLHRNVVWGLRGNVVSLPTDCPQRDERLGWTGDIQVFTPTAAYLYDMSAFLGSWLRDLAAEQCRDGAVPLVVPNPLRQSATANAAWGDAAALVPDALFDQYGDAGALAAAYPSMRAWVQQVRELAGDDDLWTGGMQLGDWLDPSAAPDEPWAAKTDGDIVASAYYHRSVVALARAARVLGHDREAAQDEVLAERIRDAFVTRFVTPGGLMSSDAHTAYGLAIGFDLVADPALRQRLGDRLAELVRAFGYRIRTGFVGTPLITGALQATGHLDVAYRLLLEEGLPSWLYPVTMGATTVWERWDSMLPDGTINPGEMTSFNHYALGAVADWLHRSIGGISPAEPGARVVDVRPVPGGGLTDVSASLDTGYGVLAVHWTVHDGTFTLRLRVPANMRARVALPDGGFAEVGSGERTWTCALPVLPVPPVPPNEPWSLDTTLARFMDDDVARAALLAACAQVGFSFAQGWTSQGRWRSDTTVRQMLMLLTHEQIADLDRAVAALNG